MGFSIIGSIVSDGWDGERCFEGEIVVSNCCIRIEFCWCSMDIMKSSFDNTYFAFFAVTEIAAAMIFYRCGLTNLGTSHAAKACSVNWRNRKEETTCSFALQKEKKMYGKDK